MRSSLRFEVSELPVGWSRISGSGIHLVLGRPSDDPLVALLRETLPADRLPGHDLMEDLLDDLLDLLLRAGVRGLPDFVAVEGLDPVRLVVRGAPIAEVTVAGEVRPIVSGGARTWADVQVGGDVELVSVRLPPVGQTPEAAPEAAPEAEPEPALPVVPLAPLPNDPHADDRDELPSYDDLFGSTQCAMAFHAEDEPVASPPTADAVPPRPQPIAEAVPSPPPVASELTLPAPADRSSPRDSGQPAQPAYSGVDGHDEVGPTVLGILRLSTGDVVSLDRGVLLGRAPKVNGDLTGLQRPHVVRLASPDNNVSDISRDHAEVLLEGWHVMVRDLGSTNGTTVALPGQEPIRLRLHEQQVIEPGTVVTLADEVSFTYEVEA